MEEDKENIHTNLHIQYKDCKNASKAARNINNLYGRDVISERRHKDGSSSSARVAPAPNAKKGQKATNCEQTCPGAAFAKESGQLRCRIVAGTLPQNNSLALALSDLPQAQEEQIGAAQSDQCAAWTLVFPTSPDTVDRDC